MGNDAELMKKVIENELKGDLIAVADDSIVIRQRKDGNWVASGKKFGKNHSAVSYDPINALQAFLVYDGN